MNIGICVNRENDNTYMYSKPFVMNIQNNSFVGQIIRDIDFSFYAKYNEKLDVSVIKYNSPTCYRKGNQNNLNPSEFRVVGQYNVYFDEITNKINFNGSIKGALTKIINEKHNIELTFNVILDKQQEDDMYIVSTPSITGSLSYFN